MPLLESPVFVEHSSSSHSITLPQQEYVLSLTSLPSQGSYLAVASSPSDAIYVLDQSSLAVVQTLKGHEGGTTGLAVEKEFIMSCGKDGYVRGWDIRMGTSPLRCEFCYSNSLC